MASRPEKEFFISLLDRKEFLRVTGFSPKEAPFGFTPLVLDDVTYPELELVEAPAKRKGAKPAWTLATTSTALPDPISSHYTVGRFEEETTTVAIIPDGPCAGRYEKATYSIDGKMAKLLRDGELEHCTDYQYAFDISLAKFAAAVNQIAGTERCTGTKEKCEGSFEEELKKKTGVDPSNWRAVFGCLALKSETIRDKRKQWHTPTTKTDILTRSCKVLVSLIGIPGLGHGPEEIIKCPEMAFASGTPKAKPNPPSKPKATDK